MIRLDEWQRQTECRSSCCPLPHPVEGPDCFDRCHGQAEDRGILALLVAQTMGAMPTRQNSTTNQPHGLEGVHGRRPRYGGRLQAQRRCGQRSTSWRSAGRGEGQAMGRTVVATQHGGATETVQHGRTGFLVTLTTPTAGRRDHRSPGHVRRCPHPSSRRGPATRNPSLRQAVDGHAHACRVRRTSSVVYLQYFYVRFFEKRDYQDRFFSI